MARNKHSQSREKVRVNGFARYEKNTVTETKDTIKRSYVEKEG